MLHDPSLSHLIWWSGSNQLDDTTFALLPGAEFSNCLTTYFKHGNVASFVRQLHMYGFHKVCDGNQSHMSHSYNYSSGNHNNNNNNNNNVYDHNPAVWEFRHTSGKFRRGDMKSLHLIKRRANSRKSRPSSVKTLSITEREVEKPEICNNVKKEEAVEEEGDGDEDEDEVEEESKQAAVDTLLKHENQTQIIDKTENRDNTESGRDSERRGSTRKNDQIESTHGKTVTARPLHNPFEHYNSQQIHKPAASSSRSNSPTNMTKPHELFFKHSRQRYPSVFVDPCAPIPPSNIPKQPLQLPPIQLSDSPAPMPKKNEGLMGLPSLSSISSQSSRSIPSPNSSISARNGRLNFSRTSSSSLNSITSQLRPSIFDLHAPSPASSISAHTSIFSGSSISSSTGSIGSISSILNEDRRLPSLSELPVPLASSSLKTLVAESDSNITKHDDSRTKVEKSSLQTEPGERAKPDSSIEQNTN